MQGARHRLDLAEVGLALGKVFEQGIEGARVSKLVLRHSCGGDGSFQGGCAITPVGITPSNGLFVIGQRGEYAE